jgi:membrane-associated protease RseP (regulator of RpoE activity)
VTVFSRQSPLAAVVMFSGIGVVLWMLGGWPLPVVIAGLLVMIMGHEFGHYLMARRAGMLVTDFFVGFGPILFERQIGETRVGVRALPIGGYVKVPGMTWSDDVDSSIEQRTYRQASTGRKVIFASAGSFMHIAMALVLAWASLVAIGTPAVDNVKIQALSLFANQQSPAQVAGLRPGDRILRVDGQRVESSTMLVNFVHSHVGDPLRLQIERGGHQLNVTATPVDGRHITVNGTPLATGPHPVGYLGVEVGEGVSRANALVAIPRAVTTVGTLLGTAVRGVIHVFSPNQFANLIHQVASPVAASNPKNQLSRPESIVGVVRIAVQGANSNWANLLNIFVLVNLFVGVMNMLPLLPLDGGYVAVALYEKIRSRRATYRVDFRKLTPVAWAFSLVLLVLFASTLYLDIAHPVVNPFH